MNSLDSLSASLDQALLDERITEADVDALTTVLENIQARVSGLYELQSFIGATLRFCLFHATDMATDRAVLLTLHRPKTGHEASPLSRFRRMLGSVADSRIGVEYASFDVNTSIGTWEACFSTFHADAQPLGSFCVNYATQHSPERVLDDASFVSLLRSLVEQLKALHDAGYTHGDITPTNILVDSDWTAHLIDFDLLTHTNDALDLTGEGATRDFTHPSKLSRVTEALAGHGPTPSHAERVTWDLYSLGKTLLSVLTGYAPDEFFRDISPFLQRYIALMYCRMLDGRNIGGEVALGIPTHEFAAISYSSTDEVVVDLRKLDRSYSVITAVPELDLANPDRLQVSSRFDVVLTQRLKKTLQLPELQALAGVRQLGLINFVFPSANHSRYEHALGTYAVTCQYVRWLLRDDQNPLFLQLVTEKHVKRLLLAALLHDIGHFPLAHDFEDAEHSLFSHEQRTKSALTAENSKLAAHIALPEPDGWDVTASDIVRLLSREASQDSIVNQMLHTIISGPIDADKVDYLVRDSERLAVQYGQGIDVRRLGSTLTTIVDFGSAPATGAGVCIGVREKGVGAAETVAFARYAMYRNVYWHHSYRVIKAMIQWVVWEFLRSKWHTAAGKRTAFNKSVQESMAKLLGGESGMAQLSLMSEDDKAPGLSSLVTLIPPAERAVLDWCAQSVSSAQKMTDALVARRLFKRVLVMSVGRGLPPNTWANLGAFFDSKTDGDGSGWMRRYVLAKRFQRLVVEEVLNGGRSGSYVIASDAKRKSLAEAHGDRQVVLVDFPDPNRAKQTDLRYLVEEERRHRRVAVEQQYPLESSSIFESIGQNFVMGIGKIRVFVDPEFAPLIIDALTRDDLQRSFAELLDGIRLAKPENEPEFAVASPLSLGT